MSKKLGIVAVLCLAVTASFAAALAPQLDVKPLATLYKQTTTHIAWQVARDISEIIYFTHKL